MKDQATAAPSAANPPPALPALDALSPDAQRVLGDTLSSLFRIVPIREVGP